MGTGGGNDGPRVEVSDRIGGATHSENAWLRRSSLELVRNRSRISVWAITDLATGLIEDWLLTPLNRDEAQAARHLVPRWPRART